MQGGAHELTQMAQPLRNRQGQRDIRWLRPQGDVVGQAQRRGRAFQVLTQVVGLDRVDEPGCGRLVLRHHPAVRLQRLFHCLARSSCGVDQQTEHRPAVRKAAVDRDVRMLLVQDGAHGGQQKQPPLLIGGREGE